MESLYSEDRAVVEAEVAKLRVSFTLLHGYVLRSLMPSL